MNGRSAADQHRPPRAAWEPPAAAVSEGLLTAERVLRTHPAALGILTVVAIAAIGTAHRWVSDDSLFGVTYAIPLVLCAYGVGLVAGAAGAMAVSILWFFEAVNRDLTGGEALLVAALRLLNNLGVVAMAALAAAGARARERYLEGQQRLVDVRADLVSAFSHDLRSPLTNIIGYAEILRQGAGDSEAARTAETLDRILYNANQLDQLIGDMLTAGRDDSAVALQVSAFEAEALVAELRAEFDQKPLAHPVVVAWRVDPGTPPLRTDRPKLVSVVRNLVSNALKFTSDGRVETRIGYQPESNTHRITVHDTGPGIPSDALPYVFDRFYRARQTPQIRGFGLGLFIVRRFTELMGGTVQVESQVGRGTTFVIGVPRLAPEAGGRPEAPAA